ncbi:type II toxin-antitoxin system prevent-host-death family antitoxin [Rhizobium sp. CECT 9324]|jgi:prevent-host-death family protein|uniref:type II toxin-antitoxin system Phd/YefM family antitoxin n=1 Tax=Rhizobium sp. CECT 9324 TaxID=2845820 RepID=UPI001E3846AE|nr:type II toxin-antitoxin system prevent-host-death family antitoxin [Rhizobium sp. CECT 9324]CAH0341828.1 hypothetical protein RHI9324_03533 [Rhizobium sp. CECT 9324]
MRISIEKAAGRFEELIERAERGESVVLTRNDQPTAVLQALDASAVTTANELTWDERRALFEKIRANAAKHPDDGVSAARSQDFLYDEDGLPG